MQSCFNKMREKLGVDSSDEPTADHLQAE